MSADTETQVEQKEDAKAIAWFIRRWEKLWGNKLALVLLTYLLGNATGTTISKFMGVFGAEQTPTEIDSAAIYLKEMRPIVMAMKPVPKMMRELYVAFPKLKGGAKALEDAQFDEFKRQQKEERQRLNLPRSAAPVSAVEIPEPEQPTNYVSTRQPRRTQ